MTETLFVHFVGRPPQFWIPHDMTKAHELWLRTGELGCAVAYNNFSGLAYENGRGVEIDQKNAKHYYELAAMSGDKTTRNNLGCTEGQASNHRRPMKHLQY